MIVLKKESLIDIGKSALSFPLTTKLILFICIKSQQWYYFIAILSNNIIFPI